MACPAWVAWAGSGGGTAHRTRGGRGKLHPPGAESVEGCEKKQGRCFQVRLVWNRNGDLVTKDVEKVLDVIFILVFTGRTGLRPVGKVGVRKTCLDGEG